MSGSIGGGSGFTGGGAAGYGTALGTYLAAAPRETALAAANARADPTTLALSRHFTANAAALTSPDALLRDYRSLSVVLNAFGLDKYQNSTALLRRLLTEDPSDRASVAYRLRDAKVLAFAKAFSSWSPPPFADTGARDALLQQFQLGAYEQAADQQTPGVRLALYFTRRAGGVTSISQLQADPDLLRVAVEGAGVPWSGFTQLDFASQSRLLKNRIAVADLQKPDYVGKLAKSFLARQAVDQTGSAAAVRPGTIAGLFSQQAASGNDILGLLGGQAGTSGTSTGGNPLLSLFV